MKKTVLSGILVSVMMAAGAALADPAALTTQGYVDAGLKAVYKAVDNVKADKETVQDLAATVADKANAADVYTKAEAEEKFVTGADIAVYTAPEGSGITINEEHQVALDIPDEPVEDAVYVYKNGEWTAFSVNPDFPSEFDFVEGD